MKGEIRCGRLIWMGAIGRMARGYRAAQHVLRAARCDRSRAMLQRARPIWITDRKQPGRPMVRDGIRGSIARCREVSQQALPVERRLLVRYKRAHAKVHKKPKSFLVRSKYALAGTLQARQRIG